MGLSNPSKFCPRSLRHMLGTQLANNPHISLKECMVTMRHKSAAANLNDQPHGTESEENCLLALGYEPPSKSDHKELSTSKTVSHSSQTVTSPRHFQSPSTQLTVQESQLISTERFDVLTQDLNDATDMTVFTQEEQSTFSTSSTNRSFLQKLKDVPSTQHAINLVKQDLQDMKSESFMVSDEKSAEWKQIIWFGTEVQKLRKLLNEQAKKMYHYECERCGTTPGISCNQFEPLSPNRIEKNLVMTVQMTV